VCDAALVPVVVRGVDASPSASYPASAPRPPSHSQQTGSATFVPHPPSRRPTALPAHPPASKRVPIHAGIVARVWAIMSLPFSWS